MTSRKPENLMRVSFPSRSVNEGLSRSLAAAFVALADPTVEELCDIKTAVSEAVCKPPTLCWLHISPSLCECALERFSFQMGWLGEQAVTLPHHLTR